MEFDLDLQDIEIDQTEQEPQVVLIDRGHHFKHIAEALNYYLDSQHQDIPLDPSEAAYQYTSTLFATRQLEVELQQQRIDALRKLLELLAYLWQLPWFKKFLKVLVQSSFTAKYQLHKGKELPTWFNIKNSMLDVLAYILTQCWPEQELLDVKGTFDNKCLRRIKSTQMDVAELDKFIDEYKEQICLSGFEATQVLKQVMLVLINTPEYRQEILPSLFSAPLYLPMIIQNYINAHTAELVYYQDVGTKIDSPAFEGTWQFNTYGEIVYLLIQEYLADPQNLVHLTTEPGAICATTGPLHEPHGDHCYRHRQSRGDLRYIKAIKHQVDQFPELADVISFEYSSKGELTGVKLPLKLMADKTFIEAVSTYRNHLYILEEES